MDKPKLTNEQRLILILLHKLLGKVEKDSGYHDRAIEILENGYYEMFGFEDIGSTLSEPLSYDQMHYVDDVLDMYRWIQDSYKELPAEEKKKIPENKILFKGFDGNNEAELLWYARFNMEKMDRWSDLKIVQGLNTHHQTQTMYKRMLDKLPKRDSRFLSFDELSALLDLTF